MSLFSHRPNWQIFYEVLSADQDRAAQFVRDVVTMDPQGDTKQLVETAAANAQKLFGRGYLVDLRSGMVRPLRMFDDAPGVANLP